MKLLASLLIYFQLLNCSYFFVDYYQFSAKGDDFYEYIFCMINALTGCNGCVILMHK